MWPCVRANALHWTRANALIDEVERIKASIRAKVEHPFRVIKRQFGFVKVRYRGLKKLGVVVELDHGGGR